MKKKNDTETEIEQPEERTFSVEALRQHAYELFGITVSTYDGATYGIDGEYTVEEMKTVIEKWLNKEVKN